jgi:hypothetical protein
MIEIGERVQLHRLASPRTLDVRAEIRRQVRRLADIPFYDCLIVIHVSVIR